MRMKKQLVKSMLFVALVTMTISGCGGSGDVDALLDDYESIVDQTIVYMDKVESGDMDVMSELTKLTSKYESFTTRMQKAEGEGMSAAQRARYLRITDKYQKALQDMY